MKDELIKFLESNIQNAEQQKEWCMDVNKQMGAQRWKGKADAFEEVLEWIQARDSAV
jgi:hypothetical protein